MNTELSHCGIHWENTKRQVINVNASAKRFVDAKTTLKKHKLYMKKHLNEEVDLQDLPRGPCDGSPPLYLLDAVAKGSRSVDGAESEHTKKPSNKRLTRLLESAGAGVWPSFRSSWRSWPPLPFFCAQIYSTAAVATAV